MTLPILVTEGVHVAGGDREQGQPQQAGRGWPVWLTPHRKACYLCPEVCQREGAGPQELTQEERGPGPGLTAWGRGLPSVAPAPGAPPFPLLLTVSHACNMHAMSGDIRAPSFGPEPFCRRALGAPVHLGAASASRGSPWKGLGSHRGRRRPEGRA